MNVRATLGLGLAFSETGSPAHNRDLSIDARREQAVHDIAEATVSRPESLRKRGVTVPDGIANDDRAAIVYENRSRESFALCTDFRVAGDAASSMMFELQAWKHPAGRTCYVFARHTSDPYRIAPLSTDARRRGV